MLEKNKPPRSNLTEGLDIVSLLVRERRAIGVTQIAEQLGMPKSSTHRVLQTLLQLGFVEQHQVTSLYTINPTIFEFVHDLAMYFAKNIFLEKHLHEAARIYKCSVYLCMLGGLETYIVCGAGDEGNTTRLGCHGPAYTTSAGKILVANYPEDEWPKYAPDVDSVPPTSFSNTDPEQFFMQLREAREKGFAWNRRESSADHYAIASVVREPFVNRPRLAIALLFRSDKMFLYDTNDLEKTVQKIAKKLERQLGTPIN
ncbi:MAG: helix-turn-helix domain-containing protein [Opitutales bacterium]|nr:helix-turn-helix domain-containing protein [Opitutales bacterium]